MKKTVLVLLATGATAALALPGTAHAVENQQMFSSPSGNIRCVLSADDGPTPTALYQIASKTFTVPPGSGRGETGQPCPGNTGSGNDFRLDLGQPGFIRCSFAALNGGVGPWPSLGYGQTRSLGAIACESRAAGITCTDTSTGHFFRVSRESYEVG
jgi:hypothetical protein